MKVLKDLKIEKIVYGGEGLANVDGKVVFIRYTAPGDVVDAIVDKETKSYIRAHVVRVKSASRFRTNAQCPYFQKCGGCDFLHINYAGQLVVKQNIMREIFHNAKSKIAKITPSPKKFYYRNKAQLPYRAGVPGFFRKESHIIVPIEKCLITDSMINSVLNNIKELLMKYKVTSYNETEGSGYVRHIVLRKSEKLKKIMVIFVINSSKIKNKLRHLADELAENELVFSVFANINKERGNNILGKNFKLLKGKSYFVEEILGYDFILYPGSFVQVNLGQAENLYKKVIELLEPAKEDRIFDAYCGPGVLSILLSSRVKNVLGVDLSEDAIKSAVGTARLNNMKNVRFFTSAAEKINQDKLNTFTKAVVNPPRSGISITVAHKFNNSNLERIVYISCNPQTLKRDIERLTNYKLISIHPYDMFPHTYHIENVALLMKDKNIAN